ncbi:4987_t:CDS:2 [Ambispora leptoticha]|uniref:4987_t:CDS:1 n=1 Tax=Ambispora leptoticha TaxID=144679 RepID=A0A9N9DVY8_9GLOM|nr:4987_t:CDS:2 [Ambispora leptoticha]
MKLIQHDQNCLTLIQTFKARGLYFTKFSAPLIEDIAALKPRDVVNHVCSEVGAEASYITAWRSLTANKKCKAEEIDKSYQCIKPLLNHLLATNPGSIVSFETDAENRFTRAFLCLQPWIKAAEHSRTLYTLDAYHSKSSYKGMYFCANAIEGEEKLVPIAFAIGSAENSDNWLWFCKNLYKALPIMNFNESVVINDREKGIIDAVKMKLPNAFHAYCVWHIEKNINTKFRTKLEGKIWAAAKLLHVEGFNKVMEEISNLHTEAATYHNEIPSETWTLCKYPRNRFGHLTSNVSESFNSWLYDERLTELFEAIILLIRNVNTLYYNRRTTYSSVKTILLQTTTRQLQSVIDKCCNRIVHQTNESVFEVKSNDDNFCVVDLALLTCTCQQFQQYRFPCIHACAAILKTHQQPSQFTHFTYYTATLQNVYKESVQPVDVKMCLSDNQTLPPATIKQADQPRKIRLHSYGEVAPENQITCEKCGKKDHNSRTCGRRQKKTIKKV